MKKAIIILLILTVALFGCSNVNDEEFKVGAVLSLTGPGAIWGETMKNGMELAREELASNGQVINIVYEDSQLNPKLGVSAYNKLVDIENVNVVVAMASIISVPLIPLADEDSVPLIATLSAAKDLASSSPYAFRFFSTATYYVDPHFETQEFQKYKTLAVLYVNDEYGVAINERVKEKTTENNMTVIVSEAFEPQSTDFKTNLMKIMNAEPDAILFAAQTPTDIVNVLKQIKELNLNIPVWEASAILTVKSVRDNLGNLAEGIHSVAFPFTLEDNSFRQNYLEKYGQEPSFLSPFGYDIVYLLAEADSENLKDNILSLKEFDSLNGMVEIQENGEINPEMISVLVKDGELVVSE